MKLLFKKKKPRFSISKLKHFVEKKEEEDDDERATVEGGVATVLAPADATSGVEILLDEVSTLLEMVDAFDAIAPLELLPDDLGFLDFDPLLPHQVLPHLQHRHRVLVRVRWIEVIWG